MKPGHCMKNRLPLHCAFTCSMKLGLPERPLIPAFSPVGEKVAAGRMRGFAAFHRPWTVSLGSGPG